MTATMTIGWQDAIESLLQFEHDIDDDFNFGLKGFLSLDEELKSNIFGFVKVGICADRIRRFKLWESGKFDSFKDYCQRCLSKSTWYVNRLIDAARVVRHLIDAGFCILPQCEAQARPLCKFLNAPGAIDYIAEAWQKVLDVCGDRITADRVAQIVDDKPENEPEVKIKLPRSVYQEIAHHAANAGMKVEEFIINMFDGGEPEPEPQEEPEPEPIAIDEGGMVDAPMDNQCKSDSLTRSIHTRDRNPKPSKKSKGFAQFLFGSKEKPK